MHRARSVINAINPTISKNFATWLIREPVQSRVSSQIKIFFHLKIKINFGFQIQTELLKSSSTSVRLYSSAASEPFLNGSNSSYIEDMYNSWLADPSSVHAVSFFLIIFNFRKGHTSLFRSYTIRLAIILIFFLSKKILSYQSHAIVDV